jgi:hypothetical protein
MNGENIAEPTGLGLAAKLSLLTKQWMIVSN